jgi:hypothetical protein
MKELTKNRKVIARQNTINLMFWTVAWVLTVALVTFGPKFIWGENALYTSISLIVNVLVGVGMIFANIHHLRGLDELEQRIHLEAMGITLGVTLVAGIAYSMMDTTNLITADAEISILVVIMAITYMAAIIIGRLRFR